MSSKQSGMRGAVVLVVLSATGVAALAWYVMANPAARDIRLIESKVTPVVPQGPAPVVSRLPRSEPSTPAVVVRLPMLSGDQVLLGEGRPVQGQEPMKYLVNEVLRLQQMEGSALLVDVREGVAVINFDQKAVLAVGSMQEGKFLEMLQVGFSQFSGIKSIKLEGSGAPLASGHFDLSEPLEVLAPDAKPSVEASLPADPPARDSETGPDPASTPSEP